MRKQKKMLFFLKNKLIVDYYFYEVFNDKHMADDITYIILIARFGMV